MARHQERWQRMLDLRGKNTATVTISLTQFSDLQQRGWRNGNTHLHLMKLTYAEADRYLREVPASDGLDLVFLSHLRRIPDERTYISNTIVENSLPGNRQKNRRVEIFIIAPDVPVVGWTESFTNVYR